MGTGGNKGSPSRTYASVQEYLNRCIQVAHHELGPSEEKPDLLRNTQKPGVYLLRLGDGPDVEITLKIP